MNDKTITIEKMTEADAKDVVKLGLETKELHADENKPMYYSVGDVKSATKSDNEICLVARVENKFVGYALSHYNPVMKEGYICDIAIKPEYRNFGIGKLLIDKTSESFNKRGAVWSWALVHDNNDKMINFMEKQGYKKGRKFYFFYK